MHLGVSVGGCTCCLETLRSFLRRAGLDACSCPGSPPSAPGRPAKKLPSGSAHSSESESLTLLACRLISCLLELSAVFV